MSSADGRGARIDVAAIRRAQIVDAAAAIVAEQGLQNLSLSQIEKRAGMSRGQLTYYFKTKEAILLAVFDHLLARMNREQGRTDGEGNSAGWLPGWEAMIRNILGTILDAPSPEFHCLHCTFLAQIGHRGDFRQRLATLYEDWRNHMSRQLRAELKGRPSTRKISTRAVATLMQAMMHGLALQNAADPHAVNSQEMINLCLELVGSYVWPLGRKPARPKTPRPRANNKGPRRGGRPRPYREKP